MSLPTLHPSLRRSARTRVRAAVIPLKDNIPTTRFAVVTAALIAINFAFFAWQLSFSARRLADGPGLQQLGLSPRDENSIEYGAIPYRVTHPGKECAAGVTSSDSGQEATVVCEGTDDYREAQDLARATRRASRWSTSTNRLGSRPSSPRCSCTAASSTSPSTCSSCGSSETTSRTRWDG